MSRKYKFRDQTAVYFTTFATVYWIDVFTRKSYKDHIVNSLNYCIENKGLIVNSWIIMTNHVHLIIGTEDENMQDILRDMKKFTSRTIREAIEDNPKESRKKWMLDLFMKAGYQNSNNEKFQFWQQNNHPLVIKNAFAFKQKLNYIHNNPVKAGIVQNAEDYLYGSARDYAGKQGLVKVRILEKYGI